MEPRKRPDQYDICSCGHRKAKTAKVCRGCQHRRDPEPPSGDPSIRFISLGKNRFATVDAADYEGLSVHKWSAIQSERSKQWYAYRGAPEGKVYMHRQILGLQRGDPREGDHVEPSLTLDNRRSNLRIASRGQQMHNIRIARNNKSGYKGVTIHSPGRYRAMIRVNRKLMHLGTFTAPELAHLAYCAASAKYHGDFGRVA